MNEKDTQNVPSPDNDGVINLKVEHYVPEGMLALYSDTALIQHTPTEFILSFFQVEHPPVLEKEDWQAVQSLKARCVARIILNPYQMMKTLEAAQTNYKKFMAKINEPLEENEHD